MTIKEAIEKAKFLVGMTQGTMLLENSGLSQETLNQMEADCVKSLLMRDTEIEVLREAASEVASRLRRCRIPCIDGQNSELHRELVDCADRLEDALDKGEATTKIVDNYGVPWLYYSGYTEHPASYAEFQLYATKEQKERWKGFNFNEGSNGKHNDSGEVNP